MGPRTKMLYELAQDVVPFAVGLTVWLGVYRFFEVRYPPHDLRSTRSFEWQRKPLIIAWIVSIAAAIAIGLLMPQISN